MLTKKTDSKEVLRLSYVENRIRSFVKVNYGQDELDNPSWDIKALARSLAGTSVYKAENKDYLQLQHEDGHPVPKTIRYTQGGWDCIEAYGVIFGMTLERAANFLLMQQVQDIVMRGDFGKMWREKKLAERTVAKFKAARKKK